MITQKTASSIARVYRDIEAGQKILESVDKEIAQGKERIGFHGEVQGTARTCKLEFPCNENGYIVYNVEPLIARSVIVAHIADQKAMLEKLNECAAIETRIEVDRG